MQSNLENDSHESRLNVADRYFLQLCVVVNDLEYLRSVISRLPTELKWVVLRDQTQNVIGESQFNNTLPLQLVQAQSFLCREIRSALDTLGKKVWHQQSVNTCNSEGAIFIMSPRTLSFQLNTDVESHVRSMSTRQRPASKSTEDVSQHSSKLSVDVWVGWPSSALFQAVDPLMRHLEQELGYMNENLVQENFNRYENGPCSPLTGHSAFLYLSPNAQSC